MNQLDHLKSLLQIHRRNAVLYLRQAEQYGSLVMSPPMVQNGLRMAQEEIAKLKDQLQELGHQPEDLKEDQQPSEA